MPFYCHPDHLKYVAKFLENNNHHFGGRSATECLSLAAQMFGYTDYREYARCHCELSDLLPVVSREVV
jgi:hypothetical protein